MKTINKKCILNCVGICLLACVLLLAACASTRNESIATLHNSRNSLDWDGVYSGIIPSASGSGIQVRIVLNLNYTFELRYFYIDRSESDMIINGTFNWNDAGSIITLNTDRAPPHYQVGENFLRQLDLQGRVISGSLAENYILRKEL
jgi:uncharacterized lipoprotein NlpE involved in copper resistance